MKTKVWLTRSLFGYELWRIKPSHFKIKFFPNPRGVFTKGKLIIVGLCPEMTKKYFELKKHLKIDSNQILEGTMEFKFKEKDRKYKKQHIKSMLHLISDFRVSKKKKTVYTFKNIIK